jgi:glycosyltransferase involved in cell wall biosynthesis
LKIELILPTLWPGGMETMAAGLMHRLAERGHEVGATCTFDGGAVFERLRDEGFRVALVPAPGVLANVRVAGLTEWLRSVRPDVAHVHSGVWLKGVRAAHRAGVPRVIYTMHGLDAVHWYSRALDRCAAAFTDVVVPVSESLREDLTGRLRVSADKVRVIPNGIDATTFRPGPRSGLLRERFGLAPKQPVVGVVARLEAIKNVAVLVDAFALLHRTLPEASLVLIGDGRQREQLAAQAAGLGVGDAVHFWGMAESAAPLLHDLDLFALSSDSEGTSISILEAMASGVPVVATAVGGTPNLLDHGRCGLLVPRRDPAALADAMLRLLASPAERRRLGAAARRRVEEHYAQEVMVARYEELYRGASGSATAAARKRRIAGRARIPTVA